MKNRPFILLITLSLSLSGCLKRQVAPGPQPSKDPQSTSSCDIKTQPKSVRTDLNGLIRLDDVKGDVQGALMLAAFWEPKRAQRGFEFLRGSNLLLSDRAASFLDMGKLQFGLVGEQELSSVPLGAGNIYEYAFDGGLSQGLYNVVVAGNDTHSKISTQLSMPVALEGIEVNGQNIEQIEPRDDSFELSRSGGLEIEWKTPVMLNKDNEMTLEMYMDVGQDEVSVICEVNENELEATSVVSWKLPEEVLSKFPQNGEAQFHLHRGHSWMVGNSAKTIILLMQGRRRWYRQVKLVD